MREAGMIVDRCSRCLLTLSRSNLRFLVWTLAASAEEPWALPPPEECPANAATPPATDARPARFPWSPGDIVAFAALDALAPYLPEEIWSRREHFFFDGMHLEIGPCFRRYAPPRVLRRRHPGAPRPRALVADRWAGGRRRRTPLPRRLDRARRSPGPVRSGPGTPARRYRGAGRFGDLRVTYLQGGQETARLVGDHFVALLMNRARLVKDDYRVSWAKEHRWVAGGSTRGSGSGSRCAFRHYRNAGSRARRRASPTTSFSTTPRAASPSACAGDPSFRCRLAPTSGASTSRWVAGSSATNGKWWAVRELLAPINSAAPAYPENTARSFGPSGASLADDRWELRRAIVLEAPLGNGARVRRYLDLETLFPLYHAENPGGGADVIFQYAGSLERGPGEVPASGPIRPSNRCA